MDFAEALGELKCHFPGGVRSIALLPVGTSIYFLSNVTFINALSFDLYNNPLRMMIAFLFIDGC